MSRMIQKALLSGHQLTLGMYALAPNGSIEYISRLEARDVTKPRAHSVEYIVGFANGEELTIPVDGVIAQYWSTFDEYLAKYSRN